MPIWVPRRILNGFPEVSLNNPIAKMMDTRLIAPPAFGL
jgi:hypothetical protein